ncbi:divergent polysaccharide deacetylase family protein [Rhodoblastus sp.]|uniref:divergent polysaccharide deacetylase family protein n=1 Tax=Rhodoblastus sp. TaxID=1962975 RepID=UPI00262CB9DF|nr:divergent polysaccharide deacetylase family protein [Rhodoblastus sp.]
MLDDLDRPLGQDLRQPPDPGPGGWRLGALALGLFGAVIGGLFLFSVKDRGGGEPEAVAVIQPAPPAPPPAPTPADHKDAAAQEGIENGVRVVRGDSGVAQGFVIHVPDAGGAMALTPAPDQRLIEKSRFGFLPRRGQDGAAPAQVYARPLALQPAFKPGAPRVAILVAGMGLDSAATDEAIRRLPPEVSLAFAPYGAEAGRQAAEARAAGHEILLQTPMEPLNPADSPGPHVLRVGDAAAALNDLHWQMSRFSGYIGVVNFLGGRFTADEAATQALMKELASRGLDYVDDGSSPQSLAGEAALAHGVGFAKADLRLDAARGEAAIGTALQRLESLARQNGVAIGYAAGLPEASERIARFAADLKRDGVVLIPVSAAIRGESLARNGKR